jgi:4-hydroxy-3-methylbut-2-enyl diphosphate reductase
VPQADAVLVFGSKNSSNSVRLTEVAEEQGCRAYLVDDVSEIDMQWFQGDETVLITAGASAPEEVVVECVEYFVRKFGATVEHLALREENVEFPLPLPVRTFEVDSAPKLTP